MKTLCKFSTINEANVKLNLINNIHCWELNLDTFERESLKISYFLLFGTVRIAYLYISAKYRPVLTSHAWMLSLFIKLCSGIVNKMYTFQRKKTHQPFRGAGSYLSIQDVYSKIYLLQFIKYIKDAVVELSIS